MTTAHEIPDGSYFTHPDLPHRRLLKHWNLSNGAVAATNELIGLLCLRGDMPVVLIELPEKLEQIRASSQAADYKQALGTP